MRKKPLNPEHPLWRIGLFLGLASCQTIPKGQHPVYVPATIQPVFSVCYPADGASELKIERAGSPLVSFTLDWVASGGGEWELEATNALGQSLVSLQYKSAALTASGPLAARLPKHRVREDGFLELDGHFVGLRPLEIPCLLAQHFPRDWQTQSAAFEKDGTEATMWVQEDRRTITLNLAGIDTPPAREACAEIRWYAFWRLFSSEVKWCHAYGTRKIAKMTGVDDYVFQLVPLGGAGRE